MIRSLDIYLFIYLFIYTYIYIYISNARSDIFSTKKVASSHHTLFGLGSTALKRFFKAAVLLGAVGLRSGWGQQNCDLLTIGTVGIQYFDYFGLLLNWGPLLLASFVSWFRTAFERGRLLLTSDLTAQQGLEVFRTTLWLCQNSYGKLT